jgi:hypothetical protein
MNKFYVKDGQHLKYFSSVPEVVSFLEQVVKLKLKTTRSEWMQHIRDLGHGYDDALGRTFTESLADHVEVGVVQNGGKLVRCSIHEATAFTKPEYGD